MTRPQRRPEETDDEYGVRLEPFKTAQKKYRRTAKGKASRKRHAQTDSFKNSQSKYFRTDAGQESRRGVNKRSNKKKVESGYRAEWEKTEGRREYVREYHRTKYSTDIEYRITRNLRNRLGDAFRSKGMLRSGKTFDLTGCSIPDLIEHLKSKFLPGMTMENYGGENGWVIDHKIPCCAFDLRCPLAVKLCFHFTNLQPLWYRDNLLKVKEDLQWQL